jgi:hypothetical protein
MAHRRLQNQAARGYGHNEQNWKQEKRTGEQV